MLLDIVLQFAETFESVTARLHCLDNEKKKRWRPKRVNFDPYPDAAQSVLTDRLPEGPTIRQNLSTHLRWMEESKRSRQR